MMDMAKELVGSQLHIGAVEGINKSELGQVTGVVVDGDVISCDVIVVAMGPWCGKAAQWLPLPAIKGQRAHNLLLRPQRAVTAHALFVEYTGSVGAHSPEVYPRPDGEVYVCGMGDHVALPENPSDIKPSDDATEQLLKMVEEISSHFRAAEAEVLAKRACYLPVSPDGLPLIGKVPGVGGAFIGGGHSCWGILTGPNHWGCPGRTDCDQWVQPWWTCLLLDPARFTWHFDGWRPCSNLNNLDTFKSHGL